jgi:hypothetical protein
MESTHQHVSELFSQLTAIVKNTTDHRMLLQVIKSSEKLKHTSSQKFKKEKIEWSSLSTKDFIKYFNQFSETEQEALVEEIPWETISHEAKMALIKVLDGYRGHAKYEYQVKQEMLYSVVSKVDLQKFPILQRVEFTMKVHSVDFEQEVFEGATSSEIDELVQKCSTLAVCMQILRFSGFGKNRRRAVVTLTEGHLQELDQKFGTSRLSGEEGMHTVSDAIARLRTNIKVFLEVE